MKGFIEVTNTDSGQKNMINIDHIIDFGASPEGNSTIIEVRENGGIEAEESYTEVRDLIIKAQGGNPSGIQ